MKDTTESGFVQIKVGDKPKKDKPNHYPVGADKRLDIWNSRSSPKGKFVKNTASLKLILEEDPAIAGTFYYSEVYGSVRVRRPIPATLGCKDYRGGRAFTDEDVTALRVFLSEVYKTEYGKDAVFDMIRFTAQNDAVNEIATYLGGLKWDGTARVDKALTTYAGVKSNDYSRAASRIFFLSAAARGLKSGTKADTALILHGAQGAGKSTFIRSLFGMAWTMDSPLEIGTKDALQLLKGKWCVELAELASLTKKEVEPIKAFLSGFTDDFRVPYSREPITLKRTAVFIGTTNDQHALRDSTGSRRFFPVTCGRIDNAAIAKDRDQLWAEAVHRVIAKEPHWPSNAEAQLAAEAGEEYTAKHPWHEVISNWIDGVSEHGLPGRHGRPRTEGFTFQEMMSGALKSTEAFHHNDMHGRTARAILGSLGYEHRLRGKERRSFWVPKQNP